MFDNLKKKTLKPRESKDQKVLTGRILAIGLAVKTTSQHVGISRSIWTNTACSFAVAWWLSKKLSGKCHTEALTQRMMWTGPGKAARSRIRGEEQQGAC